MTLILGGGGPKVFSEQPHLASGHFIKVFYKATTCPRQPILSGPKSGRLIQVWLYKNTGFWSFYQTIQAFSESEATKYYR